VRDNRIIIPSVSARLQIPAITDSKRIRLEYSSSKASKTKGKLIIRMPTLIHEIMKAFASEIKRQMFVTSFVEPESGF
jgi:hypothetical protein